MAEPVAPITVRLRGWVLICEVCGAWATLPIYGTGRPDPYQAATDPIGLWFDAHLGPAIGFADVEVNGMMRRVRVVPRPNPFPEE